MSPEYSGSRDGRGLRVGIVVARFNSFITDGQLEAARSALLAQGVTGDNIGIAFVPGSFELPLAARRMAASGRYDAVICLGTVIRGETIHFELVAESTARGVLEAGMETGVPVIFGVLATDTVEQARERIGKGAEAALAALEMANLLRGLCLEEGGS